MTNTLKYGILGCGIFGEKSLLPAFKLSKISDCIAITKQNEVHAKQVAESYKIKYSYGINQRSEFLNNPEIDAIFVAGPNFLHMQDAIDSIKAGKDVILEKPMAMNVAECKKIIQIAEKYNKRLMIAHCLRFNDTIQYIKGIIESGILGKLITGTADFLSTGKKSQRSWKYDKKIAGGGPSFDLGVHMIDTLRYLTQLDIRKAYCFHRPQNLIEDEIELIASFLLDFENDFIGRVTSSYLGSRNTFIEIFGENGYIRAYDWNPINTEIRVESEIDGEFNAINIYNSDHYQAEIDAFTISILENSSIPIPGIEGMKNQQIIDLVNII